MDVQFSFAGQDARQSDRNIGTGVKEVPKGPQRGVASLVRFLATQEMNSPQAKKKNSCHQESNSPLGEIKKLNQIINL